MARKGTGLDTPPKRARLAPAKNPYWTSIGGSRSGEWLGYRRVAGKPGSWVAKVIIDRRKTEARLTQADDGSHEPGAIDYASAVAEALAWCRARRDDAARPAGQDQDSGPQAAERTVRDVMERYVERRERRSKVRARDARWRLEKHVLAAKLADIPLPRLTAGALRAWRTALPAMAPASVNRLLNDLRAGLTTAYPGSTLPPDIRAALRAEADATEAREVVPLPPEDIRKLIDAAMAQDRFFGRLVLTLAATGLRLSQVARIKVGDLQSHLARVIVPSSAKGRATKARKPIPVPVGEDVLAALAVVVEDRAAADVLLLRADGKPWGAAAQMQRPWGRAVKAAGVRGDAVPYDLRHSSIIRALAAGSPIRFTAQVHDTSVQMIERHYARFVTNEAEAAARRAIVPLISMEAEAAPG